MMRLVGIGLVTLVLGVQEDGSSEGHGHPAPRAAIEGVGSLVIRSRITYAERPQAPEELRAVYVFPDRTRWDFSGVAKSGRSLHRTVARHGEAIALRDGPRPPRELAGPGREAVRLGMELRRALFLWPAAFEWRETEPDRREVAVFRFACCRAEALGRLVATLDAEGRPASIAAWREDRELERLTVSAWDEECERLRPRALQLSTAAGLVWREEVLGVQRNERFVESYFRIRTGDATGPRVLRVPITAMTYQRVELPAGTTWKKARDLARVARDRAVKELAGKGHEVDELPTFELSRAGAPRAVLVRLKTPSEDPPAGWVSQGKREGALLLLSELEGITAAHLELLESSLPAGALTEAPFARLLPAESPARVQLALALR